MTTYAVPYGVTTATVFLTQDGPKAGEPTDLKRAL